jgi:heme-degrading monooxygenase HmoA
MTKTFSSGMWTVKSGEEDAFVEDWKKFVSWAAELPGSGDFRLLHDIDQPNRFVSFGSWEDHDAQNAWTQHPEFAERLGRVRAHCDDFKPSSYALSAEIS